MGISIPKKYSSFVSAAMILPFLALNYALLGAHLILMLFIFDLQTIWTSVVAELSSVYSDGNVISGLLFLAEMVNSGNGLLKTLNSSEVSSVKRQTNYT